MKKLFTCIVAVSWLISGLAHAGQVTSPQSVVFLPHEAMVKVEEKLTASRSEQGQWVYRVVLPDNVNRGSFYATLDGVRLPFSWVAREGWETRRATDPAFETDLNRRELLQALVAAEKTVQELNSAITGLEQARAFWQNLAASRHDGKNIPSAEELLALATTVGKEVTAVENALFEKRFILQSADQTQDKARQALLRYDMERPLHAEVAIVAPKQGTQTIAYSYVLPAFTESVYVIDASPENKKLAIAHSVDVVQHSGIDWKDVDVSVAFVSRSPSLRPDDIQPWLFDYLEKKQKQLNMASKAPSPNAAGRFAQMEEKNAALADAAPAAPVSGEYVASQSEMSSFRLWSLGKRTIAQGDRTRIDLNAEIFDAAYYYTLRPDYGRRGIVTARLEFADPLELPQGQANCFVDNVYVGSQLLNINGKKALVYLGEDPQVTVDKREMSMQKGEQGMFSKAQTRVWHWNYTVTNSRSKAVDVAVETAQPVSLDTSIAVAAKSRPEPKKIVPDSETADEALKLFVWEKNLPAGETFTIDHRVTVDAAADKPLMVQ